MYDARRLGLFAVLFLVALRISIGWQLFYEGAWKWNTLGSARPWSAEGYLKNAKGPLRGQFHQLAGDGPYDLNWLDYNRVSKKWGRWKSRFVNHYGNLSDSQKSRLNRLVNGSKSYAANLSALPEGVSLDKYKKAITYDAEKKRLVVDGKWHLTPVERERLYQMVPDVNEADGKLTGGTELEREFRDAVNKVYLRQSRLGYKEKLAASLRGDSERIGALFESPRALIKEKINPYKDFGDFKTYGEIDKYREMVKNYEADLAKKETQFNQDHLDYSYGELMTQKAKVTGPVKALEAEMKLAARAMLSSEQLAKGAVPPAMNSLTVSNYLTIAGLIILGVLLMIGLFTRTAAFFGAVMLLSFYLVWPPWPGVPVAPGPDHAFIVNKNLIEVVALFALTFLPSGLWFGVDAWARKFFGRNKNKAKAQPGKGPIPVATVTSS